MQLPAHLQDKLNDATRVHVSKSTAPDKETPDWVTQDFLAGASYLYTLLKEEKGEVAGVWVRATERKSQHMVKVCIRIIGNEGWVTGYWDFSRKVYMVTNLGPQGVKPERIEWLDTETPVVAGCGELVKALEEIIGYRFDPDKVTRIATEALKQVK